jgi:putative membrane protein
MGFLIRVLVNAFAIYLIAQIVPGIEVSSLVTLGLFLLVLNGLCFWLTSQLVKGFEIHGFWAALWGALLVSVVSWILNAFVSDRGRIVVITGRGSADRA